MKRLLVLFFVMTGLHVVAQTNLNVVPMPAEVQMGKGIFRLTRNSILFYEDEETKDICTLFNASLQKKCGITLPVRKYLKDKLVNTTGNYIRLFIYKTSPEKSAMGTYNLDVNSKAIAIRSDEHTGLLYGIQTLLQLLPNPTTARNKKHYQLSISQLSIKDYPRFQYRGMHLDVARHFMPVSFVKKYIDYLAAYKFNTFHWHLTDDQGWRIEIKKYPLLTKIGGFRNGTIKGRYPGNGNDSLHYGGFYTQEEIKEVVKYAADRYISIVPEIEMPGHASAAIAAYPQLSCFPEEDTQHPKDCTWAGSTKGKQVQQTWGVFEDVFCPSDYTFNFLQDVIDEVMPLFPSTYIHIGGDECPKEAWKRSAFCQQLIKEKDLKDEHALQSYFIQHIEKYINSKGKKIIGWDEILEGGLAPNATVMSWRGEEGGIEAAKQNHDVIMTPGSHCYIDHSQSKNEDSVTIGGYLPLEKVYSYDPVPAVLSAKEARHILGAQANLWTEYIKFPSKVEYMIFPRMAAMAEVLWTPKEKKDYKDFERRLPVIFERLDQEKINYSKAFYDLDTKVLPTDDFDGVRWEVKTKDSSCFIHLQNQGWDEGFYDSITIYDANGEGLGGIAFRMIAKDIDTTAIIFNNKVRKDDYYVGSSGDTIFSILNYNCLYAELLDKKSKKQLSSTKQQFHFNKATGKKITLTTPPSPQYPGDGAFTLVNGVQNDKGLSRSSEFLGFEGGDCEAIIDLGKTEDIENVTVHILHQKASWIWRPETLQVFASTDGTNFTSLGLTDDVEKKENGNGTMTVQFAHTPARYVKVIIKNWGTIPDNEAGSGNKSWLFVDEIEVDAKAMPPSPKGAPGS